MAYDFVPCELEAIAKLPVEMQALKDKYPIQIVNVADYFFEPPLPEGYVPEILEIFYDLASEPAMLFLHGKLDCFTPQAPDPNASLVAVMADGHWVYTEIEGKVLLDRRGGLVLPEVAVNPDALLQASVAHLKTSA